MGLMDRVVGEVISVFKVDTTQAKAGLRDLSAEQKKAAQSAVEGIEKQNKALDGMFKRYTDLKAGMSDLFAIGKATLQAYQEHSRLAGAAAAVDMDRLKRASAGLRSETDLLRLAAAGANGAWKLSTDQLEDVVEAMRAFRKEGHEDAKVLDVLTEMLKKGTVDGLQEFGIKLDQSKDASTNMRNALSALRSETAKFAGDLDMAGDAAARAAVKMEDGIARLKRLTGEGVGYALDLAASAGQGAAIAFGGLSAEDQATRSANARRDARVAQLVRSGMTPEAASRQIANEDAAYKSLRSGSYSFFDAADVVENIQRVSQGNFTNKEDLLRLLNNELALYTSGRGGRQLGPGGKASRFLDPRTWMAGRRAPGAAGRGGVAGSPGMEVSEVSGWEELSAFLGIGGEYLTDGLGALAQGVGGRQSDADQFARAMAAASGAQRQFAQLQGEIGAQFAGERESFLASMFGPVSEFNLYAEGFELLQGAVSSAFDAWITGSKSFGAAVKDALAAGAASLAKEAIMQALRHTAYAAGAAAIGGPLAGASVAGHLKAAAAWGGVAVVASAAAKGLGGGGESSGAGGSPSGYRARSQDYRTEPRETVVVIGDVASDSGNRRRAREHRRMSELAEKYARPTGSQHG